jgi:hypothetical protein
LAGDSRAFRLKFGDQALRRRFLIAHKCLRRERLRRITFNPDRDTFISHAPASAAISSTSRVANEATDPAGNTNADGCALGSNGAAWIIWIHTIVTQVSVVD